MKTLRISIIAVSIIVVSFAASAQTASQHPGYFALEDLNIFGPEEAEVDVDLRDSMIRAAAAAADQDEKFGELLDGVQRIRVQVGSIENGDHAGIRATIEAAAANLEQSGWYRMVTVREEDELVYVLVVEGDGMIKGLTAMVHDSDDEVVLVNIAGDMDPKLIGTLMNHLDDLDDLDLDLG